MVADFVYTQMRVTYNGEAVETKIDFRQFRKYAYAAEIKYESFEEGTWVRAWGRRSIKQVRRDLW